MIVVSADSLKAIQSQCFQYSIFAILLSVSSRSYERKDCLHLFLWNNYIMPRTFTKWPPNGCWNSTRRLHCITHCLAIWCTALNTSCVAGMTPQPWEYPWPTRHYYPRVYLSRTTLLLCLTYGKDFCLPPLLVATSMVCGESVVISEEMTAKKWTLTHHPNWTTCLFASSPCWLLSVS